jgi:hypothetical protein
VGDAQPGAEDDPRDTGPARGQGGSPSDDHVGPTGDDVGPTGDDDRSLWFGRTEGGLGIAPRTWQGRAALFLYAFLVVVALVTYSKLAVTAFVIVFYTVVFVFVLVAKSDLMKEWPPKR